MKMNMKTSKVQGLSGNSTASPSTPLSKRQRRIIDDSNLSQSEVSWQQIETDELEISSSPSRLAVRAKSSNTLVQTPVRIVKRHVSSPAIGAAKIKNRFEELEKVISESDEEKELNKGNSFDDFDFSDDQLEAVLKKVDEEEQLKKQNETKIPLTASITNEINFEDSFGDAMLASIPLEELSKCSQSKTSNVEILYNAGLSQIVKETSPVKVMSKNKSMEPINQVGGSKRSFDRHSSLPQQPSTSSNNGKIEKNISDVVCITFHSSFTVIHLASSCSSSRPKCTKEEIEVKRKAAQLRLELTRQRNLNRL